MFDKKEENNKSFDASPLCDKDVLKQGIRGENRNTIIKYILCAFLMIAGLILLFCKGAEPVEGELSAQIQEFSFKIVAMPMGIICIFLAIIILIFTKSKVRIK